MLVRHAVGEDVAAIVTMSRRVQAALTASGRLQEFGPIPDGVVAAHVAAGTAYVLADAGRILGGVFVAPATGTSHPIVRQWGLDELPGTTFFLNKLMIDPDEQRRGLGYLLLDGVKALVLTAPGDAIVLDCWAGNDKLRAFYTRAGFHLHGVFPAGTPAHPFEVAVFIYRHETGGGAGG